MTFAVKAIFVLSFIGLLACHSPGQNTASKRSTLTAADTVAASSMPRSGLRSDSIAHSYTIAIAEYIKAAYKDKTAPDTIFIGRHEEFPDIALPAIIDNHPVRLTTFGEFTAADNRQVYLNIFSWFSTGNVEFLIVNFSGSGSPQHNCRINFSYNATGREFALTRLGFDNPYGKDKFDKTHGSR